MPYHTADLAFSTSLKGLLAYLSDQLYDKMAIPDLQGYLWELFLMYELDINGFVYNQY